MKYDPYSQNILILFSDVGKWWNYIDIDAEAAAVHYLDKLLC